MSLWALAAQAYGQDTRIESQVVASGGGHGSSGSYTLSGTLGQPAANAATGTTVALQAGFWTAVPDVVVEPDGGFHEWMDSLPPDQQPPPDRRGPDDIAAGDGMTNLLKYALGLPPMTPAAEAAPAAVVHDGLWGIELERSTDAAVGFHVETSLDLTLWEEESHSENPIGPGADGERERVLLLTGVSPDDVSRFFLRLRVVME